MPILSLSVKKGDHVHKGDVIAEFDTTGLKNELLDQKATMEGKRMTESQYQAEYIEAIRNGDPTVLEEKKRMMEQFQKELAGDQRRLDKLSEDIHKKRYARAPYDGIVTSIPADGEEQPATGSALVKLIKLADGYSFKFQDTSEQTSWLELEQEVSLTVNSKGQQHKVKGIITSIEDAEGASNAGMGDAQAQDSSAGGGSPTVVTVTVHNQKDDLQLVGAKASLSIQKKSNTEGMTIPVEWIKQEQNDKYVLVVSEEQGVFGNEFTVNKVSIVEQERSGKQVLVTGLMKTDRIVTETSEPLKSGDHVRLK